MMKICSQCGTNKPFSEFSKYKRGKNGLQTYCKCCATVAGKEYRKNNSEKIKARAVGYYKNNLEKAKERVTKYRNSNPEKTKERNREYYKNNPEKIKEAVRRWYKNNPGVVKANKAERRAAKLQRTVGWGNRHAITHIYKVTSLLSEVSGIKHEVDHVIPLQGEFVSGLHVADNLQILTAFENHSKSNTFVIT